MSVWFPTTGNGDPIYLPCACFSRDHAIIIERDDDDAKNLILSVIGTRNPHMWTRLRYGLGYIFGGRGGSFADVILNEHNVRRLRAMCDEILAE